MNKRQAKIAWWLIILLSVILAIWGLIGPEGNSFYEETYGVFVLFTLVVPVVLIFGFAFIRAREKGKDKSQE